MVLRGLSGCSLDITKQPIDTLRIQGGLSTGIRTQVGVKVFGKDLKVIEDKSAEIEKVLRDVPGAVDLYAEKITGAPYLEIRIDRDDLP